MRKRAETTLGTCLITSGRQSSFLLNLPLMRLSVCGINDTYCFFSHINFSPIGNKHLCSKSENTALNGIFCFCGSSIFLSLNPQTSIIQQVIFEYYLLIQCAKTMPGEVQ